MGATCASCGTSNRDAARFCASCGKRLSKRCVTCDAELPDGARFCDECGAPVGADDAADIVEAGARKLVTIVFADLVGSTTAQEQMDPEAVRAENQQAYALMRAAIERHAGTVVKFVGDGMMAVFGVPEVREDDARRALAAAIDLRSDFGSRLRVGVNTGEVVVADDDNDVMGDAVNVASRLEHEAPAGGVLVGDETYRLTRGEATFEAARELAVKGRAQPVEARVLVDLASASAPAAAALVGRDAELTALLGAVGTAEATNQARLVTIVGSPGVGKSRLLAELQQRVGDAAVVLTGRCSAGGASSLEPVAEIVRAAVDACGGIEQLGLEALERERVSAVVDALLGGGHPGTPQETFWAIRRVIEGTARARPLVVVLDDLHWAEPMVLDVVEHLAEWLDDVPVLLVAAGRPELRELRPALVEVGARPAHVISLEGLDPAATRSLAEDLLGTGGLPAEVVDRIVGATGGNPLFIRELLRMLVEDGVLRAEGDQWALTVDPDDVDVPETINALLAARIERLAADERVVLERASVLGQDVVRGALADLVPAPVRARLPMILETLRRKELLEPSGAYWIDEPVLRFHHVLIRDAAYRRVLKAARAELHERAARWIATKADGEEHDELIGYHLEQSHLSRRDLGELDEGARAVAAEAGTLLGRAARRSLHRDQLPAAASLANRALACLLDNDADRAELLLVACEALLETGDTAGARDAIVELTAAAADDVRLSSWVTAFTVQLDMLSGTADLADAERRAAEAADALAAISDRAGAAKCHRVRAAVLARLGRIADSESALDLALTATRQADDRRQISGVLAAAPLAALWGPSPVTRAGGRCLDVVRLLRITTGAREVEAISVRCQALLEAFRGRDEAARSMIERARAMLEDLGSRHGLIELELFAGMVELVSGQPEAAEEHLLRAEAGYRRMGLHADAARAAALRAGAALSLGDEDRALDLAETAAQVDGSDLTTSVAWRAVKAAILARHGELDAAIALAEEGVALAEPTDALMDRAAALSALAGVLDLTGDTEGASAARERAHALYEQKGATAFLDGLSGTLATESSRAAPSVTPDLTDASTPNEAARVNWQNLALLEQGRNDELAARFHPEFATEFRRFSVRDRRGLEGVVDSAEQLIELGFHLIRSDVVATRGEMLALLHEVATIGDFEDEWLAIMQIASDGRALRYLRLEADDVDAAIAELDRLAGAPAPNRAARLMEANMNIAAAERWDELPAMFHPDYVYEDRRPGPWEHNMNAQRVIDSSRATAGIARRIRSELVATRGDLLALLRDTWGSDEFENECYYLAQFDESGLVVRSIQFGSDDYDAAIAELDRLAKPTTPQGATLATVSAALFTDLMRADRWDEFARFMHPNAVLDDRRPLRTDEQMDRERTVSYLAAGTDVGQSLRVGEVLAIRGERLALVRQAAGDEHFEEDLHIVLHTDEYGRNLRAVILLGPDDLESAIAELDALAESVGVAPHPPVPPNRASLMTSIGIALLEEGRWDDFRLMMRPDYVFDDRRPVGPGHVTDREVVVAMPQAMHAAGAHHRRNDVVATRGDRLALLHQSMGTDDFEDEWLCIIQIDERDLHQRFVGFAVDDLDAAMAELDRLAAEESEHPMVMAFRRSFAALVDGRSHAFRDSMDADFLYVDRRHGGIRAQSLNRAQAIEVMRAGVEMGLAISLTELVESRGDRLALIKNHQATTAGFSVDSLYVARLTAEGRIDLTLDYDTDQLADAMADLDGLAAALAGNGATRVHARQVEAFHAGDVDAFTASMASDFVRDERRSTWLEFGPGDRETIVAASEVVREQEVILRPAPIAAYGEHHALVRVTQTAGDDVVDDYLILVVTDHDDRQIRQVQFDVEDLNAALDELRALAAPTEHPVLVALRHGFAATVEGRWDDYRDSMHPDYLYADRRHGPVRTPSLDREATVGVMRDGAELGVSIEANEVVASRGDRLAVVRNRQSTPSGFDMEALLLIRLTAEGLIDLTLHYDLGQRALATDDLAALAAGLAGNTASAAHDAGLAAVNDARWDDFAARLAPDFVWDGRRKHLTLPVTPRDDVISAARVVNEQGLVARSEPIAARDSRFALVRDVLTGSDGTEGRELIVVVTDEEGHQQRNIQYDVEDLDSALTELARLAGEAGASENIAVRTFRRLNDALIAGDWDRLRECLAEDFVCEERRTGLCVTLDTEQVIDYVRVEGNQPSEVDLEVLERHGERLALIRATYNATSDEFAPSHLHVIEVDEVGRVGRAFNYDVDAIDEARATFAALARVLNRATRWADQWFGSTDWDAYRAAHSAWFVGEDRRPIMQATYDLDGHVAGLQAADRMAARLLRLDVVATQGDTVALVDTVWGDEDGAGRVHMLVALALDGDGRKYREMYFEPDARAEAIAALADLVEPQNAATRIQRQCNVWLLNSDFAAIASVASPDMIVDDRRPGRAVLYDADESIVNAEAVMGAGFDRIDTEVIAVHDENAAMMRHRFSSDATGFFEDVVQVLVLDDDGRCRRNILLEGDAIDEARAELDRIV